MNLLLSFLPSAVLGAIIFFPKSIINHHKGTIIGLGFTADRELMDRILERHFSEGKKAADFTGMISQSSIALIFATYLHKLAIQEQSNVIQHYAMFMSFIMFSILYAYISYKTMKIIVYYFMRDAANNKTIIGKIYPVSISLWMGACFMYGQNVVVNAIVASHTIFKNG